METLARGCRRPGEDRPRDHCGRGDRVVVVFLAFLAAPDVFLKLFGIGLASAIFLDATVVRMVLVPAVMQLLGSRNWWIPSWLERMPPRLDVEHVAVTPPGAGLNRNTKVGAGRRTDVARPAAPRGECPSFP